MIKRLKYGTAPANILKRFTYIFTLFICFFLQNSFALGAKKINVQVSVKPIHGIVSFICKGVAEPGLLMEGSESPHTQSLTPRQLIAVKSADLVIWVGKQYETNWRNPFAKEKNKAKFLTLIKVPGLKTFKCRPQINCIYIPQHDCPKHKDHKECDESCHTGCKGHSHGPDETDGHIWLSVKNAQAIAKAVADKLSDVDQSNKEKYQENCKEFIQRSDFLSLKISKILSKFKGKAYLIYHDSLQYLLDDFSIEMVASIVVDPGFPSNANDLKKIRDWLNKLGVEKRKEVCLFSEPGFQDNTCTKLSAEYSLKTQEVDYVGYGAKTGAEAYFEIMEKLVGDIAKGLS